MPTLAPTFAPTNLAVPTTPSFQAPAPAPAPVTVNVGGTSSSQSTAQPQVTAPVKSPQQQQIDANFSNRMSQNLSGTQPFTANTLSSGVTPKAVMTTQEKLLQDFLANQKTLQDQIATNMQPGSEEAGLRQRLNQQRTQSALNQEQALNSGETSSFAGGEAQRVGRTDAIKTAGLEAQVQTMQDGRANALSSLQVLINSNDKSISTQLEIQKLQNTVSSIDKNAEATFFNLQQSNPSVAYDYDNTITPLENLNKLREGITQSSAPSRSAPFQATLDIAASAESGIGSSKRIQSQLENLANTGDYKSLMVNLKNQAKKMMTAEGKSEVVNAAKSISAIDRMTTAVKTYQDMGGEMGFLKGKQDDITTYFGKLSVDSRFKEIGTELTLAFQQYRKDMTGAAFGVSENREYSSVLPSKDKEIELNFAVMRGLRSYMNGKVEDSYKDVLGDGYLNVRSLVEQGGQPQQTRASNFSPETIKQYDDEAMTKWGYTPEEIQTFKDRNGISFNQVGNTTASVSIPKTSRLASVNNNPGNLRFAGQVGAVKGEGGFAKFTSPGHGYTALKNQINLDASRGLSLESFIGKYAPPSENNTNQYITQAVKNLGVSKNTPIKQIPAEALAKFIALKESSTKIS